MDWTKFIVNMFTSSGKDSHTWPRSMFKSGTNHLCAQRLSFQHNEKPDILRLNCTGESASEEEFLTGSGGFVKKGILGDIPVGGVKNLNDMPCQSNHYQASPVGPLHNNSWSMKEKSPIENIHNFNMAQRCYRYPAFGVGCRPMSSWQQYGNGWGYPCHTYGGQGILCGNSIGQNGYPMGYAAYHQGMPFIAGSHAANNRTIHRQFHRMATQNVQSQEGHKSAKRPVAQKNGIHKQVIKTESATTVGERSDVNSVADTLSQLHITSDTCHSQSGTTEDSRAVTNVPLKMHINGSLKSKSANIVDSGTKTKKEDIPSLQQKVCDNCKKCSSKEECMGVGYCLLNPSGGRAKLTLILGSKENVGKLSNTNGKNGYHEKPNIADLSDSNKLSDETVPSQSLNSHLHHDKVHAGDISSSHSPPGSKPNLDDTSTPSNSRSLAQVLLQRSMSSKRRQHRPSARRRQKVKVQQPVAETHETPTCFKKQKINHRDIDDEVPYSIQNTSKTCSTIAYILGISPPCHKPHAADSTESTQIRCKVSIQPDKFSFTISSSEDTDFSDDEDDVAALSEDDADIWNSFNKCDDPYNPLNFLTSTCSSTPKGIPKSNSAPSLLSPEVLQNEDVWKKDTPPFSPPKPEALARTAKKVHFATDVCLVQVHAADDWERKGPWEQMALDSQRFQKRIQKTEETIGYVFSPQHRQHILKKLESFHNKGN